MLCIIIINSWYMNNTETNKLGLYRQYIVSPELNHLKSPSPRWTMFHERTEPNLHIVTLRVWICPYLIHYILNHPQYWGIAFYLTFSSLASSYLHPLLSPRSDLKASLTENGIGSRCEFYASGSHFGSKMSVSALQWLENTVLVKLLEGHWRFFLFMYLKPLLIKPFINELDIMSGLYL